MTDKERRRKKEKLEVQHMSCLLLSSSSSSFSRDTLTLVTIVKGMCLLSCIISEF